MPNTNVDDVVGLLSNPRFLEALQKPDFQDAVHKLHPPSYEYFTIWVLIATVLVAAVSAILVLLQLRADHERSRRELGMNLIRDWSNLLEVETAGVLRFVRLLNKDQCEKLDDRKPFIVEKTEETANLLKSCLEFKFPEVNFDKEFDVNSSTTFGCAIFSYQATVIEGQFQFLRRDQRIHLATLRSVIEVSNNTDAFPCLTRFLKNLKPRSFSSRPRVADALFRRGSAR